MLKLYLNDTMVLKNNVIDIFNSRIIAIGAIVKCPSYLLDSRAIPTIQYRTTKFKSIRTKS